MLDSLNSLAEINLKDLPQINEVNEANISFNIDLENLIEEIPKETDLSLDKTEPILTLKKPNQVYFELYKEARNKAKYAKKNAILAYLEAKNIKKTYMIENMDNSDSDFDAEIEEVSESELEGL